MTEQANQFRRLSAFLGGTSLAVVAELAGGPDPKNMLVVAAAGCFGLCMPIAVYIFFAVEYDGRLSNFPYRRPDARWWEQRVCFIAFITLCSMYVVGVGLLLGFFSLRITWAFLMTIFILIAALAEGLIPKKNPRPKNNTKHPNPHVEPLARAEPNGRNLEGR
jgi:hypothetical protein